MVDSMDAMSAFAALNARSRVDWAMTQPYSVMVWPSTFAAAANRKLAPRPSPHAQRHPVAWRAEVLGRNAAGVHKGGMGHVQRHRAFVHLADKCVERTQ